MEWRVPVFLKGRKAAIHTASALTISLIILIAGDGVSGLIANTVATVFYSPFRQINTTLARWEQAAGERDELRARVVELTSQLQFYHETVEENRRLRSLLGFRPPPGFRIVPAEIVGVYGSGVPSTVLINLGERNNIRANQAVITRTGVAGRVARVLSDYSVVYLITEPRCRVAARIQRSREQGIIRYSLKRGMYLDNVPRSGDVVVGDTVITSGLGGIFPEGLVIGEVVNVAAPENEFFFEVTVEPSVNVNGLDELYILVSE